MSYRIILTRQTRDQLDDLHTYIAAAANEGIARRFTDGLLDYIGTLAEFPQRGTPRGDLRRGLRTVAWKRRVTIAFMVEESDVVVIGVFYGGRDFETLVTEA